MNSMKTSLEDFLLSIDVDSKVPQKKRKKKKGKKKQRKLLTVRQPSPYEYYLYVVLNPDIIESQDDSVVPEECKQYNRVIAIPLGISNDLVYTYDPDSTSVLENDSNRSPTGMSNVENLQVFGDALLENSATRLRWEQKNFSSSSRLSMVPTAIGRFSNTISPTVSVRDGAPYFERVYLRRTPLRRTNGTGAYMYADVIGFKPKGSETFVFERSWALDSYSYDVRWSMSPTNLKLKMLASYVSHDARGPNLDNTPPPDWAKERCKYQKMHYEFSTNLELPQEITDFIQSGGATEVPQRCYEFSIQREEQSSFEEGYYYSEWYHNPGGNAATYMSGRYYVGPPPQWEWASSFNLPAVDIAGILVKARQTYSYEVGSQQISIFGDGYNLGNKTGRPRGGTSVYSELQDEAISTNRYINTNLPMFFADLANSIEDWNNLADQFRGNLNDLGKLREKVNLSGGDLKMLAQDGANTYLPLKYGWALTQAEAEKIGNDLTRIWEDVRLASDARYLGPARRVEYDVSTSYLPGLTDAKQTFVWNGTVRPQPNSFSGLFAFLEERSLWLTMKDAWDWVPYSFVVNWFTQLPSQGVAWADFQAWKANYDLVEACRSYKLEGRLGSPDLFGTGEHTLFVASPPKFSYYLRTWNQKFDPPSLNSESSWQDSVKTHWCELGALIIQRL